MYAYIICIYAYECIYAYIYLRIYVYFDLCIYASMYLCMYLHRRDNSFDTFRANSGKERGVNWVDILCGPRSKSAPWSKHNLRTIVFIQRVHYFHLPAPRNVRSTNVRKRLRDFPGPEVHVHGDGDVLPEQGEDRPLHPAGQLHQSGACREGQGHRPEAVDGKARGGPGGRAAARCRSCLIDLAPRCRQSSGVCLLGPNPSWSIHPFRSPEASNGIDPLDSADQGGHHPAGPDDPSLFFWSHSPKKQTVCVEQRSGDQSRPATR